MIDHFIVVLVSWTLSGSEAEVDLVMIQTLELSRCKFLVSIRKALLTYERQKGLYHSKVTSSLTFTQRQGHQAQLYNGLLRVKLF